MVVFGSGTPVGTFGGAIVQNANGTGGILGFNNSGETIEVENAGSAIILTFDSDALSNNPNESYTRNPDITGSFEQHNDNTTLLFSPGTYIDGSILSNTKFNKSELSIYPNPVNDGLVTIKSQLSGAKNIELYDMLGRSVLNTTLNSDVLDVRSLRSGLYLLKVSIDDRSSTTKLIIK